MTDVLKVNDLRRVCGVLLDMVEGRFGAEIDLSRIGVDLYRERRPEDRRTGD
ncbi:hypothetical protein ACFYL6_28210 [Micromonospora sp. NPDC007208]|uniref:hypothetical protein n=1 Tax=Micromonospora sp. NPDC007208 TaxID=3364236 RepID=UPI0036A2C3AE